MLLDLFSIFDPTTYFMFFKLKLNWLSSMVGFLFLPYLYWSQVNRSTLVFNGLLKFLSNEFKLVVSGNKVGSYFLFVGLFIMILLNNLMGMFPYIFTSTSHLAFSLSFSLVLWMSFMIFGWLNFTNSMFCHLVPLGTPALLMPFMVCIESVSNIIRLGTLAVRLSANMISGHLLLCLLGNQGTNLNFILCVLLVMVQTLLMILEFSVSMIQAYVFSILSALYSSESNGSH